MIIHHYKTVLASGNYYILYFINMLLYGTIETYPQ